MSRLLESKQQRTTTLENSHQSHKQVNKGKKERTQDLTRFDNLLTSSEQKGREFLSNQLIIGYKYWGQYSSLYSQRSYEEKKTKNTEFGSKTNSESDLKTGRASALVD